MHLATRLPEERRRSRSSASASRRRSSRARRTRPARAPPQAAHRDLPARRRRRPQHGRAVRRARLLRARGRASRSRARTRRRRRARSRRLLRLASRGCAPLKPLWDARQLAIVHACGSPDSTRSHFDAQDYMETGTPGVKSTADGWLNRYLQAREHAEDATPFRAVALAPQLPRIAAGHRAGARDEPARRSSASAAAQASDMVRRVVRGASTPRPPIAC